MFADPVRLSRSTAPKDRHRLSFDVFHLKPVGVACLGRAEG